VTAAIQRTNACICDVALCVHYYITTANTEQVCEYIQAATDLCPRLLSLVPPEFTAAAAACPGITPPAKITTMAQATTIINAGIKIAEDVGGAGVSVPGTRHFYHYHALTNRYQMLSLLAIEHALACMY
jgi:hypothetical protein